MTDQANNQQGLEEARRLEKEELGLRQPNGWTRWMVPVVALCWSCFQLSAASWLLLESTLLRAIHLAFAFAIVFLAFPMLHHLIKIPGLRWLSERDKVPLVDMAIALTAIIAALYIVLDYEGIASRVGSPNRTDMIFGIMLVIALLEAARRVIGPALPVIALGFTLYAFFGPYMPEVISFKGVSLNRYVSQISLATEGIYGIPLDVSANIVFLFVLFGSLLARAGAGHFFIELAMSLLGGFRGGPAKAAVMASGLTGLVSGSSIANVVTTGTFTIPLMKKVGYPPKKAAAIEVAASTDGQIMPPIMGAAAFIIAEYINIPYIEVCKAAAVPAFASYASNFYITHVEACKLGLRGLSRAELPVFFTTLIRGAHFLVPMGVLIYELLIPRHSPQLAAFRAVMVLLVIMIVQPLISARMRQEPLFPALKKGFEDILVGMVRGARNMVSVAVATAAAGIIVGVVTMGLGGLITDIIDTISGGNVHLMLIYTALASLLIGIGLPTTATYIVMASLTAPAIVLLADQANFFVPLIAAHLFCFYYGILADDTPPVGLAAYAAAAIAKSPPIPTGLQSFSYDVRTGILPFMFIFNHDLLLWNINSIPLAILIFVMTCLGMFAFISATQGWFVVRNRWHELPLLLGVTILMLRPDMFAEWLGIENHYLIYPMGLALYGLIYGKQKWRQRKEGVVV